MTHLELMEENKQLREEAARLRAALEPFAVVGRSLEKYNTDFPDEAWIDEWGTELFTFGDCRRAAALVRGGKQE